VRNKTEDKKKLFHFRSFDSVAKVLRDCFKMSIFLMNFYSLVERIKAGVLTNIKMEFNGGIIDVIRRLNQVIQAEINKNRINPRNSLCASNFILLLILFPQKLINFAANIFIINSWLC
jgi:hypothetical protein